MASQMRDAHFRHTNVKDCAKFMGVTSVTRCPGHPFDSAKYVAEDRERHAAARDRAIERSAKRGSL